MSYTDNPLADFNRYYEAQCKEEEKYPICDYCGEPIYDSYYYIDGETICQECLEDNFKREVEI